MRYTHEQMQVIFEPKTVAAVVAPESREPGESLLQALLSQGFKGAIFPVSRDCGEMLGLKTYSSLGSVPGEVDLAVILVDTKELKQVVYDCARKNIRAAVIFTHDLTEASDPARNEREREIVEAAHSANLRLVGPNSMGACCPDSHLCFFPAMSACPGSAALVSQGGSSGAFVTLMGSLRGLGFSKVVSTGSECDLAASDFIDYLAEDEKTRIIMAYLESAHDGRALLSALRKASITKPVIVYRTGLEPAFDQLVSPHDGQSVQTDALWDAALRQTGAVRAYTAEETVDIATAFHYLPEPKGRRVSIISGPGGPAVAAADALEHNGLLATQLDHESLEKLRKFVPPAGASLKNPIDLGVAPWAIITLYSDTLNVVDKDKNVDAMLLIGGGITAGSQQEYVELMTGLKKNLQKPCMLITWAGLRGDTESAKILQDAGYPLYASPERALSSYSKVVNYYEWRSKVRGSEP